MKEKRKKEQSPVTGKRDNSQCFIMLKIIIRIIMGHKTSQEFAGMELQENGHFKKIELEK